MRSPGDREPSSSLGEGDWGLGDGDRSSSSGWLRDGDTLSAEAIVKIILVSVLFRPNQVFDMLDVELASPRSRQ